jgi:hypothetical protein
MLAHPIHMVAGATLLDRPTRVQQAGAASPGVQQQALLGRQGGGGLFGRARQPSAVADPSGTRGRRQLPGVRPAGNGQRWRGAREPGSGRAAAPPGRRQVLPGCTRRHNLRRTSCSCAPVASCEAFAQGLERMLKDVLRRSRRPNRHEPLAPAVILSQRPGGLLVSSHPDPDRLGLVVLPLNHPAPALVADALRAGRPDDVVVDHLAGRADAAAAQAGHDLLQRRLVAQDGVQDHALLSQ